MDAKRNVLNRIPPGVLTGLTICAILWLTLAPDPLPDNDIPMFEGMDKVVHACMFGGLYFMMALDRVIVRSRKSIDPPHAVGVMWWGALFCVAFGGAVELIQGAMAMGRGCDLWDFVADTVGVALSVALTPPVLKWLLK